MPLKRSMKNCYYSKNLFKFYLYYNGKNIYNDGRDRFYGLCNVRCLFGWLSDYANEIEKHLQI